MASIERTAYPRFKKVPNQKELNEIYSPAMQEIMFAHQIARGDSSVLGFLIMLKSFQRLGYFPSPSEIPIPILDHIRHCLSISKNISPTYPPASLYRHQKAIREYLHVIPYGQHARHVAVQAVYQAAQVKDSPADLVNVAIAELIKERCELPAFSTLDRLARRLRSLVNFHFFQSVFRALTSEQKEKLDQLFLHHEQNGRTAFHDLKELPKSVTIRHFEAIQTQYSWLMTFGNVEELLKDIPNLKIKHFAAEARTLDASEMSDFSEAKMYTMLLCMIHRAKVNACNNMVDMFIKSMGSIHNRGKEELEELRIKNRAKTENLISILTNVLQKTCEHPEDDTALGKQIRTLLQTYGGTEPLLQDCEAISSYNGNNYLPLLWKHYKSHRNLLFRLVRLLDIQSSTQDGSLMEALRFILENQNKRVELLPATIDFSFASDQWERTIMEKKSNQIYVLRRHLEVCVFSHLSSDLRTGDLHVSGSEEYADYREQLLPWENCESMVADYCREMEFELEAKEVVKQLKTLLSRTAEEVDRNYPDNQYLVINENGEPTLKRLKRKESSKTITKLENAIYQHLPERNIIEILCNVQHWLNWTRHFGPMSGSDPKLDNPIERYIILAFGYGCNLGPHQTSKHMRGIVTPHMLSFANRRHVTANKLDEAIRDIINCYHVLDLPRLWGDTKKAIADGTMHDLYAENLLSEYHIRYGGYGAIAYHHISDTYIALFSHFIPCGVWEAIYIIDGLLKNKADIQPDTVHADTQGQSTPVFALSHLLGINLMPRIRNWKDLTFFRPNKDTVYEHIDSLFTDSIDWDIIETHWRDLLQVVLSIKGGKILPSTLLRKLSNYSRKNKLYQAFQELGRVIRTVFLLKYISNMLLREQITASTNKIEAYNGFSKWCAFGGEGVISENDPIEQEKRIKYNDLVADAIILQNVVDMTGILRKLSKEGFEFTRSDVAALSPYLNRHIKRFGDYVIELQNVPDPIDREILIPAG